MLSYLPGLDRKMFWTSQIFIKHLSANNTCINLYNVLTNIHFKFYALNSNYLANYKKSQTLTYNWSCGEVQYLLLIVKLNNFKLIKYVYLAKIMTKF